MLDQMPADNAAAVIEDLPEARAEQVRELLPEAQAEEIQELLEYGEQTARRIISPWIVAIHEEATLAQAIDDIRELASPPMNRSTSTSSTPPNRRVGGASLRRLLTALPTAVLKLIATPDVVCVPPTRIRRRWPSS